MKQKRIFIGNLSFEVTKEEMLELLSAYGSVVTLRLRKNEGFALVEMSSPEENQAVLQKLEGMSLKGRVLHTSPELSRTQAREKAVREYQDREKQRKGPQDNHPSPGKARPGSPPLSGRAAPKTAAPAGRRTGTTPVPHKPKDSPRSAEYDQAPDTPPRSGYLERLAEKQRRQSSGTGRERPGIGQRRRRKPD